MTLGYICDNCKRTQTRRSLIFNCIFCDKEICEDCMFGLATCKTCAASKKESELQAKFDEIYN